MRNAVRWAAAAAAAACLVASLCPAVAAKDGKAAANPKAGPIKVVILVGGHGYDQKTFEKAWGGHEDIRCEVWKGAPYSVLDDLSKFHYDAILMFNLTSGMTEPQKANFLKLLGRGVGLVVWHHALANCQDWPEFEKIAGCRFWLRDGERDGKKVPRSGTGWGTFKMHVADPNHPITKGLADFEIADESYNKQTFAEGIRVLVTTEDPKSDKAVAWAHTYSGARVFGCQSGHDIKAWANPGHRLLLANGLRWVARRIGPKDAPAKAPGKAKATG
ncbi:MAG TPA: ThuA domain-containing protein [Phycisphaerae bacterium]|nr:ThuA domain-containing protein [Phycisphaerae bacterium]